VPASATPAARDFAELLVALGLVLTMTPIVGAMFAPRLLSCARTALHGATSPAARDPRPASRSRWRRRLGVVRCQRAARVRQPPCCDPVLYAATHFGEL
jgi:hypothetical protein